MPTEQEINDAIDGLGTELTTISGDVSTLATDFSAIDAELKGLEAGTIPQATMDKITAFKTQLDSVKQALDTQVTAEAADVPANPGS